MSSEMRELIAKWRHSANEPADGSLKTDYDFAMEDCANDLETLLARTEAGADGAEEWREVARTDGAYSVSDRQRVRNNRTGKYLSTRSRAGAGYVKCDLHVNGDTRQTTLHRVVAEAFVDNPHGYNEVNHLDGDKTNNLPSNLEWCDRSRQTKHSFYELGQVVHKVQATPVSGEGPVLIFPSIEMAARHGFKSAHIYSCLNGVNKSHGDHYWESLSHPQDASGDAELIEAVGTYEEAVRLFGRTSPSASRAYDRMTAVLNAMQAKEAK